MMKTARKTQICAAAICHQEADVHCPDRLDPVPGAAGLLQHYACSRIARAVAHCPHRRPVRVQLQDTRIGNLWVVDMALARGSVSDLVREGFPVLPFLANNWELSAAWTFARDYTARRIPWALVRFGTGYRLYILRVSLQGQKGANT
jgi:hypothetical protein